MVKKAREAMNPEQIEEYRKFGEKFYGDMNFDKLEENLDLGVKVLLESVKSGLHPSYLSKEEKDVLLSKLGTHWYEKYGYSDEDFNEQR